MTSPGRRPDCARPAGGGARADGASTAAPRSRRAGLGRGAALMTSARRRRGRDAPSWPGRAGTGAAAAAGLAPGWRCSAAWWLRLSSGSRRAGRRAVTAAWRRSTAARSAWRCTTGLWPSAAAATRECAGLREAAGPGRRCGEGIRARPGRGPRPAAAGRSPGARRAEGSGGGAGLPAQRRPGSPRPSLLLSSPGRPDHPVGALGDLQPCPVPGPLGSADGLRAPIWVLGGRRATSAPVAFDPVHRRPGWAFVNKCLVVSVTNSFSDPLSACLDCRGQDSPKVRRGACLDSCDVFFCFDGELES